ncbi:MAG: hypothetical protein ACI4IV_02430 [Acutalibacteraceae bacterium]
MEWFFSWWASLDMVSQALACVAIPATVVLVIQTLLLLLGVGFHAGDGIDGADHDFGDGSHDFSDAHDFGHIDHDHDFDHDHDHDHGEHSSGIRLFSVRGFVAFFAVGGWLGIAMIESGVGAVLSVVTAFAAGVLALLLVAFVMKLLCDMQESGNIDLRNAVAKNGKVYIRIPAARAGAGKITLTLQGTFSEMDAVTDYHEDILPGKMVQVVAVTAEDTLVVRPLG